MKSKESNDLISITIISKDRIGLINEYTSIISDLDINILNHNAKVINNRNNGMVSVFKVDILFDEDEKVKILRHRLSKIKGIISVQ